MFFLLASNTLSCHVYVVSDDDNHVIGIFFSGLVSLVLCRDSYIHRLVSCLSLGKKYDLIEDVVYVLDLGFFSLIYAYN